jgi:hypothetical protein
VDDRPVAEPAVEAAAEHQLAAVEVRLAARPLDREHRLDLGVGLGTGEDRCPATGRRIDRDQLEVEAGRGAQVAVERGVRCQDLAVGQR